ncbi:MAG: glycosyltransferase family 4 protein [Acidobacteriia bacterium]|nr:glycosyltransferase family 4 protein [Terriglobia bacterium]
MRKLNARRTLVLVSQGLGLDGGGTAVVGRLLVRGLSELCAARGRPFTVLHLGSRADCPCTGDIVHFRGSQLRLGWEVAARQARREVSGIVFDHLGPARLQALLPGSFRSRFAVYLHGIEAWQARSWQRLRALRLANVLLANSHYTAGRTQRELELERHVEIVSPVLEERPAEGTADGALLGALGERFLLMVGRMAASERYKGHDELLEAMAELRGEATPVKLVVVGGGDDIARLRTKAVSLGVSDAVTFTGFVSEATKQALFERAAAFVMPSRDEGFGLVYLEAMRAGCPCVALANTAAAELITDNETGLLVPDLGRAVLGKALRTLLDEPEWAKRLGEGGRLRWRQRHQYPAFRDALEERLTGFLDA